MTSVQRPGGSPLKWILVGLGIAAALGLVGCVACAAVVALTAESEQRAQRRHTIADGQGKAVRLGTPRTAVVARFGDPAGAYDEQRDDAGPDCMYWNIRGGDVGDQWQLCFATGRLVAKYRWA